MKKEVPGHPKTKRLAKLLDGNLGLAVGSLDLLWVRAATYAPRGDVGRYSDGEIEDMAGWTGEPGQLVRLLIEARWLDEAPGHRLLIHDWPDHCEDYVHAKLATSKQWFANGAAPKLTKLNKEDRAAAAKFYSENRPPQPAAECGSPPQDAAARSAGAAECSVGRSVPRLAAPSLAAPSLALATPRPAAAEGGFEDGLTSEQHQQANELAVEFVHSSPQRKPWAFGDAFAFFAEKVRLGCDVERVRAAIKARDRTHSPGQFWIDQGLGPKLGARSESQLDAEIAAALAGAKARPPPRASPGDSVAAGLLERGVAR